MWRGREEVQSWLSGPALAPLGTVQFCAGNCLLRFFFHSSLRKYFFPQLVEGSIRRLPPKFALDQQRGFNVFFSLGRFYFLILFLFFPISKQVQDIMRAYCIKIISVGFVLFVHHGWIPDSSFLSNIYKIHFVFGVESKISISFKVIAFMRIKMCFYTCSTLIWQSSQRWRFPT